MWPFVDVPFSKEAESLWQWAQEMCTQYIKVLRTYVTSLLLYCYHQTASWLSEYWILDWVKFWKSGQIVFVISV